MYNFKKVSDSLYRGSLPSASDLKVIKSYGVKTVLDFNRKSHPEEKKACEELGLEYIHLPWTAYWFNYIRVGYYRKIAEKFIEIVGDKKKHPIFVHCYHGRDRTGMLVAIYRIVYEGWRIHDALEEMKEFNFKYWRHWDLVRFLKRYAQKVLSEIESK